jgi:predicted RNase H-like HicB family nuclease
MTNPDGSVKEKTMHLRPLSFYLEQQYPFSVTPDPDGGYFISYPDLPGCMSQVDEPSEIGPAAEEIRTLWLETAHEQGMDIPLPQGGVDYSGKFVVRVPRHLHRRLAESAALEGVSLNQYVVSLLATNDALTRVERHLAETDRRVEALAASGNHGRDVPSKRRRAALSIVGNEPTS